ncbi:MAG: hypothetical protein EA391_00040 [Balneolaceae bacterium]|nr:MAG: hypothetical protein EA391_00040 [Balneolaceae bacterium]
MNNYIKISQKQIVQINPARKTIGFFAVVLLILTAFNPVPLDAQQRSEVLSLSIGTAGGLAPHFTLGDAKDFGISFIIFGDLQFEQYVGQLSFTSIFGKTIGKDLNTLDSAFAIHGSLGYSVIATDRIQVPVMATMGGMFINYTTISRFGPSGNSFTDGNLQMGISLAPRYSINEQISVYGSLQFLKGIIIAEDSEFINLTNVGVGIRFTLI